MKRVLLFLTVIFSLVIISSANASEQIDYASMCDESKVIKVVDIKAPPLLLESLSSASKMVDLDLNNDNVVDAKLICFDGKEIFDPIFEGQIPLKDAVTIPSPADGQQFILHNLKINLGTNGTLKIGSNVILDKLNIVGTSTNPIQIIGSNVKIIDSKITSTQTGISIKDSSNVEIISTIIGREGESFAGSKGLDIQNSKDVLIDGSGRGQINLFEYGVYIALSSAVAVKDETFKIVDATKSIYYTDSDQVFVNNDNIGKVISKDDANKTELIAGAAPLCSGGLHLYFKEKAVELNEKSVNGQQVFVFTPASVCKIRKLEANETLCFRKIGADANVNKEQCIANGDCACLKDESCVFECEDTIDINRKILFTVGDSNDNYYTFSDPIKVEQTKDIIATGLPTLPIVLGGGVTGGGVAGADVPSAADTQDTGPVETAEESEFTDQGGTTTAGIGGGVESGGDAVTPEGGMGGLVSGGSGVKTAGCSLNPYAAPLNPLSAFPPFIVLTCGIFLALRTHTNRRKKQAVKVKVRK